MKLYSGPLSLFSRKVEIALGEKGLAFEREMVAFTQERGYQPKHPEVLAANPKGQVPVLVDGDITLFDSTLIFEYLEEAYPAPPLLPPMGPGGAKARARCRLMELRADEVVFPHARAFFYRTDPPHPDPAQRKANEEAGARAEAALREHFAALDKIVSGAEFLCGHLSYADIAMFMTIIWTQRLKGPPLPDYPALAAWFERLRARPPFGKAAAEVAAADRELTRPIGNASAPPRVDRQTREAIMSVKPKIARIWRGRVPRAKADAYARYNYEAGIKPLEEKAMGVQSLREDRATESEFITISYWESIEAMARFTGSDPKQVHHLDRDQEFLIELPHSVQILEIIASSGDCGGDR